ncbi:hypothetical protein D3C84_916010 [compost metagenome]
MLTRNKAGQPNPLINRPPKDGPRAVPTADSVASSPMALPVLSWATVSPTSARVNVIMMAAPRPCSARPATSSQSEGARPHTADAKVNRAIPVNSNLRRPIRSPKRPTLTISVVIASR